MDTDLVAFVSLKSARCTLTIKKTYKESLYLFSFQDFFSLYSPPADSSPHYSPCTLSSFESLSLAHSVYFQCRAYQVEVEATTSEYSEGNLGFK